LPETFSGCLVANEVLDAMPTHVLRWTSDGVRERGVGISQGRLCWSDEERDIGSKGSSSIEFELTAATNLLAPLPSGYQSEINLAARAWVETLARRLRSGALLLIDYGLPQHELYHPSRDGGTVRCHYRHRVHNDPFWFPGLSDITSHVDFTAMAEAGFRAGLDVLGYANQASFLINCGIGELLQTRKEGASVGAHDTPLNQSLRAQGAVNLLLSPNEMGELFKVIALGRGIMQPLLGFTQGNRVHAL